MLTAAVCVKRSAVITGGDYAGIESQEVGRHFTTVARVRSVLLDVKCVNNMYKMGERNLWMVL